MKISCARKITVAAAFGLFLTGCFEDNTEEKMPVRDVQWFQEHNEARHETLSDCANNPGELSEETNCENALEAEQQLSSGSLRNVDNW